MNENLQTQVKAEKKIRSTRDTIFLVFAVGTLALLILIVLMMAGVVNPLYL